MSKDHNVAKSLDCSGRLVHCEELTGSRSGRKGRPCVLCGKVFLNNAKMIIQMRSHTNEKPYRGDHCIMPFSLSSRLNHMRSHSGEKPYMCLQCNASFSDLSSLHVYMVKHTGNGVL